MSDPNAAPAAAPAPTQAAPSTDPKPPAAAAPSQDPAQPTPPAPAAAPAAPAQPAAPEGGKATGADGKTEVKLTLPKDSLLEQADLDRIAAEAAERGLSQEDANALVRRESEAIAKYSSRQLAQLDEEGAKWVESARKDPELGGAKFDENKELARRFVDRFGSDELKRALVETGLGNHPEFMRLCLRAGKASREDTLVTSGLRGMPTKKSPADILYPSTEPSPPKE